LSRQVGSTDPAVRDTALRDLKEIGADAAPAVPAVLRVLREGAWQSGSTMTLACDVLRLSPSRSRETVSLLVHLLVEAEADRSGESVHNCVEAIAADLGPSLIPAAVAATALEAKAWWKEFGGDVPSMFDSMALARASFGRPLTTLGARALPGVRAALADRDSFVRAEAAAFLAQLGDVARPALPALTTALTRERSHWPRHEMQTAIDAIGR